MPLFSGFMYAAVGSYICQAFRRIDLRVTVPGPRRRPSSRSRYANFFTHHYLPDLRVRSPSASSPCCGAAGCPYTVGDSRYGMPLSLSFVLIGFFLWVAENAATFLGAWKYPGQVEIWQTVHARSWVPGPCWSPSASSWWRP